MLPDAVQLSHAELLLALGLLGLPLPLALGPQPADAFDRAGLGAALGGLAARDLLRAEPGPGGAPQPAERLAALARAAALAEGSLVVVERRGAVRRVAHISARGAALVLHTSPRPGVHRLAPLADVAGAADWLAALLGARPAAGPLPAVTAPALALAGALDALGDGERPAAILAGAGVPAPAAAALVAALGPRPARFALGLVSGPRSPHPVARGALALSGEGGAWWGACAPGAATVALTPAGPAAMRRELLALAAQLAPAA